ncbi:hypothetical protein BDR05DRAFT_460243 [Suillus weaverae]|nr:hypothetical protein BDR05DRAFT_460243 [Suillus weaverae]
MEILHRASQGYPPGQFFGLAISCLHSRLRSKVRYILKPHALVDLPRGLHSCYCRMEPRFPVAQYLKPARIPEKYINRCVPCFPSKTLLRRVFSLLWSVIAEISIDLDSS